MKGWKIPIVIVMIAMGFIIIPIVPVHVETKQVGIIYCDMVVLVTSLDCVEKWPISRNYVFKVKRQRKDSWLNIARIVEQR